MKSVEILLNLYRKRNYIAYWLLKKSRIFQCLGAESDFQKLQFLQKFAGAYGSATTLLAVIVALDSIFLLIISLPSLKVA